MGNEKFTALEAVGRMSTIAHRKGHLLGRDVNVFAYESEEQIKLVLENNGSPVKCTKPILLSKGEYQSFKDEHDTNQQLYVASMNLFDCETMFK